MTRIYTIFKIDKSEPITLAMVISKIKHRDDQRVCPSISGRCVLESSRDKDIKRIKKLWKHENKPYKEQSKRCKKIIREILS